MRESAERLGLGNSRSAKCKRPGICSVLNSYAADLFVVCDYGQILSPNVLSRSRLGGINLHGSLLPRYRGAAPINWALFNGDKITGNTVILMTPKLDGGPILETTELPIESSDTAVSVEEKLSKLGPESRFEMYRSAGILGRRIANRIAPRPNSGNQSSPSSKIERRSQLAAFGERIVQPGESISAVAGKLFKFSSGRIQ